MLMARLSLLVATLLFFQSALAQVHTMATIRPLQFIASAVLLETDQVTGLGTAGHSHHHFELLPSDRLAFEQADIVLWVGSSFEAELVEFVDQLRASGKQVVEALETPGLNLIEDPLTGLNPHIWLDPENALVIATELVRVASALNPQNTMRYEKNLESFERNLDQAMAAARSRLQAIKGDFAVYHDAFAYFEQQVQLQHGASLLQPDAEQPGIRRIIQVRQRLQELQPVCLLAEPDSDPALIETFTRNLEDLPVISLDPLGQAISVSGSAYLEFIQSLVDGYTDCLVEFSSG